MKYANTITCLLAVSYWANAAEVKTAIAEQKGPTIQVAILLDTSGSMSGLIEQAKTQLWKVVNEFALAEQNGKRPDLQVALYEYGKSSVPASDGYVRLIVPLSTDLDKVSEQLFALSTNGGEEYCGKVIKAAAESLAWSNDAKDYKVIFIAGNEPFTQGDVDYKDACIIAITKGIMVNTIFCGPIQEGISTQWKDGALLADGSYMNIDQNKEVVAIKAPQDEEISRLGLELNKTYIPFGAQGVANKERQEQQEANTQSAGQGSFVQRQISKASGYYRNASWDLVDACKEGKVELTKLKKEDLPAELQKLSQEDLDTYVETKRSERAKVQKEINDLNTARRAYIDKERNALAATKGEDTLDAVMIRTVRGQAEKKAYIFK
ncbi:MAG: VWA domain-containing protein [Planctomycetota bacterium]|nr:VWA domain-containing protein [Planctomycetota bacterium]MDA1141657.1 VWA domain-containing protein [Planctomycetota bacterium]